jgi:hypothetical protein
MIAVAKKPCLMEKTMRPPKRGWNLISGKASHPQAGMLMIMMRLGWHESLVGAFFIGRGRGRLWP